jgi:HD superfamily phosphohydrolase
LHNVPQLDQLHFVLPGAQHSRFIHALHTFDLARSAVLQLLGDWRFRLDINAARVEAFLFKALLDDTGHYHFVHMFEDFVAEHTQPILRDANLLSDADVFRLMVGIPTRAPEHPLRDVFAEIRDHRGRSLAELVEQHLGSDWVTHATALEAPTTLVDAVLGGLLSSPVDVDKVSYLIDDSLFAGLSFGRALDAHAIFGGLTFPEDRDWHAYQRRVCVGVRESAVAYLENAVLARYWQIQRGYWHRTNRSLQAMVKFIIAELLRVKRFDFTEFVSDTLHVGADAALRWLHDRFETARENGIIDAQTTNPLADLVASRRRIYKRLVTVSPKSWTPARAHDHYIFEALQRRSPMDDSSICNEIALVLSSLLPNEAISPGDVLIDLPRREREELGGVALVYADEPREFVGELFSVSPVLSQLREAFDLFAKRMRVFVHPRIWESFGADQTVAHNAVLERLRTLYVPHNLR